MQVAGLSRRTYTHDVWKQMGRPGHYVPQTSNIKTIEYLRANRGIGILPLENTLGGPVGEVLSGVWTLRQAEMPGYVKYKVQHILAGSGTKEDIKEIWAHNQALMQCSGSLGRLGANPNRFIDRMYKSPEMFETKEYIIEIDDRKTTLADITRVISENGINIEYLHSAPNGIEKYKFHLLVNDEQEYLMKSDKLIKELENVGGELSQENYDIDDSEDLIKLVPCSNNTVGIKPAKENPHIGVICSREAALDNDLKILEEDFCPKENETRFSVISTMKKGDVDLSKFKGLVTDRTMGLLSLPNEVGSLYNSLEIMRKNGLSLSFIMSVANNLGRYDFPLVINRENNGVIKKAQKEIESKGGFLRVM